MKFEYDLKENYFSYFNLIFNVVANKKKLLRNPQSKIRKYTTSLLIYTVSILMAFVIFCFLNINLIPLLSEITAFIITFLCFLFFIFIVYYIETKKHLKKGFIEINEEGITDSDEEKELSISIKYEKIEFIYIKDDKGLIILKNDTIIIMFKMKEKEKFIQEISKKNKEVIIIDQSK